MRIKVTFIEELLGTLPNTEEVYREFIGAKAPDAASIEEEVAALGADEVAIKGTTVFPRAPDGTPFLYDYQIKGFFKDACSMLARLTGKDEHGKKAKAVNESGKLTAYKKVIDGLIFVKPREILLHANMETGKCERPLRAQTAQGERIALASSESLPAGTWFECEIICLNPAHENAVREWLDYGEYRGVGQWRNSGKGRFLWEEYPVSAQ